MQVLVRRCKTLTLKKKKNTAHFPFHAMANKQKCWYVFFFLKLAAVSLVLPSRAVLIHLFTFESLQRCQEVPLRPGEGSRKHFQVRLLLWECFPSLLIWFFVRWKKLEPSHCPLFVILAFILSHSFLNWDRLSCFLFALDPTIAPKGADSRKSLLMSCFSARWSCSVTFWSVCSSAMPLPC